MFATFNGDIYSPMKANNTAVNEQNNNVVKSHLSNFIPKYNVTVFLYKLNSIFHQYNIFIDHHFPTLLNFVTP